MADSLLQLLIAHGVLATDITDVERDAACEANRRELVHSHLPNRRPRDQRGRNDPRAYLEHDRHAQASVEFFLRRFAARRLQDLPDEGIELIVYSRFDSDALPVATTRICERLGAGRAGPALRFCLYNTTGDGISGFHYDPLLHRRADLPRVSLLRPRAVQDVAHSGAASVVDRPSDGASGSAAGSSVSRPSLLQPRAVRASRVVSLHDANPLETEARRDVEAMARARRRVEEGERGRAVDFDGQDIDRRAGGPSRPMG